MNINNKRFHISFWLLICFITSLLIFFYLMNENKSIILAIPSSIIPMLSGIITILAGEKVKGKTKYYPISIFEYIFMNLMFFLLFIFVLFSLKDSYTLIKIGAFIVMTLVGIYSSYFIMVTYKNKK